MNVSDSKSMVLSWNRNVGENFVYHAPKIDDSTSFGEMDLQIVYQLSQKFAATIGWTDHELFCLLG